MEETTTTESTNESTQTVQDVPIVGDKTQSTTTDAVTENPSAISSELVTKIIEFIDQANADRADRIETDHHNYGLESMNLVVKDEMTAGDMLVGTLLAFVIIIQLIKFFHSLILGGKKNV